MTGISGSGTSPSQFQICSIVGRALVATLGSLAITLPGRIRISPLQELHLRQKKAQVLAVHAPSTPTLRPARLRQPESRLGQGSVHMLEPGLAQTCKIDGYSLGQQSVIHVVHLEHLSGVRPEIIDGRLDAPVAFVSPVAEDRYPVAAAPQVIGDLL